MIAEETGHTEEEVHAHFKWRFLRKHGKLETVKSTTELSTAEMEEYIEKVRTLVAVNLSLIIPNPNEVDYEDN